ncbi:MAG TPA: AMP-binding protein, partial [Thermoanaerobaculia bacterium]|nr:AMP-binding protein [Thermoanaerobaculia bacterium]
MTEPAVWPEVRPATLAGLLRARAAERRDRVAFTFLTDGEVEGARLTYAELDRRARTIAARLRSSVAPGERALLLYPPGLEFIAAFFGCLYAGVVAVPAYPPRLRDRSQARLRSIARDAEPRAALTTEAIFTGLTGTEDGLAARLPELASVLWLPTDTLAADEVDGQDLPEPDPESIAFLQYTSGSTSTPKGVMVTHANLLHNERMIGEAFGQDEDSVVVGWLPLYHDMGLIGNVLQPLHAGARCVLMAPVAFLQKPSRWLAAVSRYRATTSGGPNFSYDLCARRIGPEERAELDLSSWRVAYNGAEPVREATLARFAESFASCGFRREAFYPCYGLAEATLFVSGGLQGRAPRVAGVDAAALERHEVAPAGGEEERRLVSNGWPWLGQRVVTADPETGVECPPGQVGEVWISGPSVARGYWRNPEATGRDFQAALTTLTRGVEGPFLRTGDLGFLHDGELFVTGRIKDLVIIRGRNHYPQDLELTAERSHPDLRPGSGAAFSVDVDGEERLVVVQEVDRRPQDPVQTIAEAVRRAVAEEHEVQVHEVVLVRAGTVPKTSSGKIQRHACLTLYLGGELAVVGRSSVAEPVPVETAETAAPPLSRAVLAALDPAERRVPLLAWLRASAARFLGAPAASIDPEQPLTGLGLDSLAAIELKTSVETALAVQVPLADLLQGAGLGEMADRILVDLEAGAVEESRPVVPLPVEGEQPLSFGQKSLWFLDRLAPEGGAYNIAVAARVLGGLDVEALRRSLAVLTARHAALRTVFHLVDDEPVQRVLDEMAVDLAGGEDLVAEAFRPFSLELGPLVRVRVLPAKPHPPAPSPGGRGGEKQEQILLFVIHHIATDFWSLAVLAREVSALYRQETGGPAAELEPVALRYTDYVHWQAERLAGAHGERLWGYWRERLAGLPDLDLPTDRPRPPVQTYAGGARSLALPPALAERLRSLAAGQGATLYIALLAAFQAQLARYTGQDDLAVGSPTAGRGAPELVGVAGYFVNPVVMRTDLSGEPSFAAFLGRVRTAALTALEHADFPFALLAERLRPVRDPARSPLFQAMLVLQRGRPGDDPGLAAFSLGEDGARIDLGGLALESVRLPERRAQFDLTLRLVETADGGLGAVLEHNADLFDGATADRMLGHLQVLLDGATADPRTPLPLLPLLTPTERGQVLVEWNATRREYPQDICLHELFEAQVEKTPQAEALVAGDLRLTYAELNARANRLASHLRKLGVGPEVRVGVCLGRSADLIVSLLSVLKAGGAYVPLDPAYPRERLEMMLEDSGAAVLVARKGSLWSDVDAEEEGGGASLPGRWVVGSGGGQVGGSFRRSDNPSRP